MTDKLSAYLRHFASDIRHLTLTPSSGANGRGYWQAACMFPSPPGSTAGYAVAFHDDPAQALANAILDKKRGQPGEYGVLYFHHRESGSVFKIRKSDPDPRNRDPLVEEIDVRTYHELCIEYEQKDLPLSSLKSTVEAPVEPSTHNDVDDFF